MDQQECIWIFRNTVTHFVYFLWLLLTLPIRQLKAFMLSLDDDGVFRLMC